LRFVILPLVTLVRTLVMCHSLSATALV